MGDSMKIDWSKITEDKIFQRLTNHLFSWEINSPDFIPSNPDMGADGGWDGRYEGYYPLENDKGVYSIQSKFTNKSYTEAIPALKRDVEAEIGNAIKNKVDHLRISTNAELKVEQVLELEGVNQGRIKSLKIWHRENLTIRIEKQPYLLHYFFGNAQYPVFVPWTHYFKSEPHLTKFSYLEIPSFVKYIREVEKFITTPEANLLLLHGPGGYGKTHLLREIIKNSPNFDSNRQTLMVRPGLRPIQEAVQEEIVSGRKYLLILDDSERFLTDIKPLLTLLQTKDVDLKIILSFRSAGSYLINKILSDQKQDIKSKEIKISDWSQEELSKLLRITCESENVKDEEIIISRYPNPYLIVWIGHQIKNNPLSTAEELKNKFVKDILTDSARCITELSDAKIKELLITFASLSPFNIEGGSILKELCQHFEMKEKDLFDIISKLQEAGILRKIGRNVRFNPDMKGDILLGKLSLEFDQEFLNNFVLKWSVQSPENLFSNIGAAFRDETDNNPVQKIMTNFVREWIEKSNNTDTYEKKSILKRLTRVAFLIPKESLDLLMTYLSAPDHEGLTTDDFGPLIEELIRSFSLDSEILNVLLKIVESEKIGTYSNYKPETLTSDFFSPLKNPIEILSKRLDLISNFIDSPTKAKADILVSSLSEILAATHEYSRSFGLKIEFGERALLNIPAVVQLREKAMGILKKMFESQAREFKLAALEVAENLGRSKRSLTLDKDIPLTIKFPEERKAITQSIKDLIKPDVDMDLLSSIEDLLVKWWAQQVPGTEGVNEILRVFPRSPEYLTYRYFTSREFGVDDFSEIETKAPTTGRWSWFVHNIMRKWDMTADDFKPIVEKLNTKYTTNEKLSEFLKDLAIAIAPFNFSMRPLFLLAWVKLNPDLFKTLRATDTQWGLISERFQNEIDAAMADIDQTHVLRIKDEVLNSLPNASLVRVGNLIGLLDKLPQTDQSNVLFELVTKGSSEVRRSMIFDFYRISERTGNVEEIVDLLLIILEKEEINERMSDNLGFLLHHLKPKLDTMPVKKAHLQKVLLAKLLDVPSFSWHGEELLEFATNNVDDLIDSLTHRFNRVDQKGYSSDFRPIPFEGIKFLSGLIKSYEDFEKLINKFLLETDRSRSVSSIYAKDLIDPIVLKKDSLTGKYYIAQLIETLLSKNSTKEAIKCANLLPLGDETMDTILEVSARGLEAGLDEEVKSLLYSNTSPSGAYNSEIGKVPGVLVSLKEMHEKMLQKCPPGKLKSIAARCVEIIQAEIDDHIKRDQEIMSER